MDEYDQIKKSGLKFKGETKKRKKKSHHGKHLPEQPKLRDERAEDAEEHGDWWKVHKYDHIKNDVAIEYLPGCYAKSLSNGRVILGDPHPPGEGPDEEEIFTAISLRPNKVSFKTGFDRYLAIDSSRRLMGLSEAIGELESFMPVFEEGKMALCAQNDCFLSIDEDSAIQQIVARSEKAGPNEMLTIRVATDPMKHVVEH